jgi:hypothetical protein
MEAFESFKLGKPQDIFRILTRLHGAETHFVHQVGGRRKRVVSK